jgi:hypothetical protein
MGFILNHGQIVTGIIVIGIIMERPFGDQTMAMENLSFIIYRCSQLETSILIGDFHCHGCLWERKWG